jgi:hypothetical protein
MNRCSKFFIVAGVAMLAAAFISFQQSHAAIFEATESGGVQIGLCLDDPKAAGCTDVDCNTPAGKADPRCVSESQAGTGLAKDSLTGTGITHTDNLGDYIIKLVNFSLPYLTLAAFVGYVVAGFMYVTAFGNDQQLEKAKKILIWSSIGLILVILSYAITNLLTGELVRGLAG